MKIKEISIETKLKSFGTKIKLKEECNWIEIEGKETGFLLIFQDKLEYHPVFNHPYQVSESWPLSSIWELWKYRYLNRHSGL